MTTQVEREGIPPVRVGGVSQSGVREVRSGELSETTETPVALKPELRKPWTLVRDQRIRFLLVGGFNTVLGYSLFALFDFLIGDSLGEFGYMLALVLSYALAMTVAFFLHRKFVFRVKGKLLLDFGRFVLTNMVGFGLNAVILPLMVTITGLIPLIAQAITAFIVAIASYLLHKHFSFRRTENGNS